MTAARILVRMSFDAYNTLTRFVPGCMLDDVREAGHHLISGWIAADVRLALLQEQRFGETLSDVIVRMSKRPGFVL